MQISSTPEAGLDEVVETRLFHWVGQQEFELLEHHPNVDSWLDRWNGEGWTFEVSAEVMKSARDALNTPGAEFVVREPVRVTRLDRV